MDTLVIVKIVLGIVLGGAFGEKLITSPSVP